MNVMALFSVLVPSWTFDPQLTAVGSSAPVCAMSDNASALSRPAPSNSSITSLLDTDECTVGSEDISGLLFSDNWHFLVS